MATFAIVHGAFGGGWEWRDVATALRRGGHEVHTPTLTGLGERSHLLDPGIGLATHVTDVEHVLRFEDLDEVVLVGHSYGGMVVMGVADRVPERIARLVCVDGFVPMPGQSSRDLTDPGFYEELIAGPSTREGDGWRVPPWDDGELGEAYTARVRDHPLRTLTDPVVLEHGPPSLPGTYVRCVWPDKDLTFWAPSRANAERLAWDVRTIESPHDVAIANPEGIAALLAGIAADAWGENVRASRAAARPEEVLVTDAHLLQPGEARSFPMGPDPVSVLLEGTATGGAFSIVEAQLSPGIPGPPPHIHHDGLTEIWYVLDGELEFLVGEESIRSTTGGFAYIPPETLHTFSNVGATVARWLGIFSPAKGLEMLEELAPAFANPGPPDVELMGSVFERFQVEVVGGPPPG